MNLKLNSKQITTFCLALLMLSSVPLQAYAAVGDASGKRDPINGLDVSPYKLQKEEKAQEFIKNKEQPAIYTFRTNYKVQKGEKYKKNYQPYVASVGASIGDEEKAKVKKEIKLPNLKGYIKPQDSFTIDYDTIKREAEKGLKVTKEGVETFEGDQDFQYKAKKVAVKVKHVFQTLSDLNKYGNKSGATEIAENTQLGSTGSTMEVKPLEEKERKGFEPEAEFILTQVPEDTKDFELEYRYNRAYNDVVFDCDEGTPIPARTLYYEQKIPKIAKEDMPTKSGMDLIGWKPSVDLEGGGAVFKKDEIMKDASGKASLNLDLNLQMPAEKVTFTAVWKSKEKADYTVLFWAEKPDHPKDAKLLNKYDFVGTHVYKDQKVGTRPNLENEPVKGVEFADLDGSRLKRIYNGEKVKVNNPNSNEKMEIPYLNKFYVYNQDLTNNQNGDSKHPGFIKTVSPTGETVYNIYYDRQVYDLWFTKASFEASFYPTLTRNGEVLGKPGAPYHFKARFNQSLVGMWPNDILEVSGFNEGYNSIGWSIVQGVKGHLYRDTPPYRLTANEFVDYPELSKNGLAKEIPMGEGVAPKKAGPFDIAFGIDQSNQVFPIHVDFLLDGFADDEQNYDYDLYMIKSDTNNSDYDFTPPALQGFRGKGKKRVEQFDAFDLQDDKNEERNEKTPFPEVYYRFKGKRRQKGKIYFMWAFPKMNLPDEEEEDPKKPIEDLEEDENEDSGDEEQYFEKNGYLAFEYARNKYELKLNNDPEKAKDDAAYKDNEKIQVFYDYPLKKLNLDQLHKPEKPKGVPDQWEFKGWAMDTKGQKLLWKSNETMPARNLVLYAQWGEPDYKWKVTFDANGGSLPNINTENLCVEKKTIKEGDIKEEKEVTYPLAGEKNGDKQVFTVVQHQIVNLPEKPKRKGYEFRGWELIRYKKDKDGQYTDVLDTDYSQAYRKASGAPELYAFDNDVVSPVYLKAIWVPTDAVDVKIKHYFLDDDFNLNKSILRNPLEEELENKRVNYLLATTGDKQDEEWILASDEELKAHEQSPVYKTYKEYNDRVKLNNTYFQTFRVESEKIVDPKTGRVVENPKFKNNGFKFFYRRYRIRKYKVNYVDVKAKKAIEAATNPAEKEKLIKENSIVDQDEVISKCRDFDARNYKPIKGWVLAKDEKPQQQLFYDVDDRTNEFLGINGTGSDEITFYYRDARILEVNDKNDLVPEGYVRVTFKADKGGSFGKNAEGEKIEEIHYDVIKGLLSDNLPVPRVLKEGTTPVGYYIMPDPGKNFMGWQDRPLFNENTLINKDCTFTAHFDWHGIIAKGFVATGTFKDSAHGNNLAPTIDAIKAHIKWREGDKETALPAGATISLFDDKGNTLTKDEEIGALLRESDKADKDELVRTVAIKAKVWFKDNPTPNEVTFPIKVYKNRYEALNAMGDKPKFLYDAEQLEAKDGGLKDVTGNYVKVTVAPTGDMAAKDDKVYYVNPKAWVNIPEVKGDGSSTFINWTADKEGQNDGGQVNGSFDFAKRHKFTEDTVIKPVGAKDVVEQKDSAKKPNVPGTYVKVTVETTDKATDDTAFEKIFWVNPTKDVAIDVKNPTGKTVPGAVGYKMDFAKWQSNEITPRTWSDKITGKFVKETTILAKYSTEFKKITDPAPKTDTVHTPQGKIPTAEEIKSKITPPNGKTFKEVKIVKAPDVNTPGDSKVQVIVEYTDGSSVGTNDKPMEIPVKVHAPIVKANYDGTRPKDAMDNYVKVTFTAGKGGSVSGDLVYYVSPEVAVDMTDLANKITKTPTVGYISGDWDKKLKATFSTDTEFCFNFTKSHDIIEKTSQTEPPKGYVTITFKADANGAFEGGKKEKVYYVNPAGGIKLVDQGKAIGEKELVVPKVVADPHYGFERWYEDIDETNVITSNRIYVAKFKLGQVTLTYDGGEAEGAAPKAVKAAYGTSIRLAAMGELRKGTDVFDGWKIGETVYRPGDEITLTEDTVATAHWLPDTKHPDEGDKPLPPNRSKSEDDDDDTPSVPIEPPKPHYPEGPTEPMVPEVRRETIIQEKIVKVMDYDYGKEVRYLLGFGGNFRPHDGLTRAEAAQILANALVEDGYAYDPSFALSYRDIGEAWYTRAIKITTAANVFAGYEDGSFRPQNKITRNEWIATLKRFEGLKDGSGNAMSLSSGHWAMKEVDAAYNEGWLKIYEDGLAPYDGDKFIPREEVAAVSNKAFNRVLDKTYIGNNNKSLVNYKDVNESMWSYNDILCASNTFLYKKNKYRAHWVKGDNNLFNIDTDGFNIVKEKFQRNPR